MEKWRPSRVDLLPVLAILLVPVLVSLPQLVGLLNANPLAVTSLATLDARAGMLPGVTYNDPNYGYHTFALGYFAASEWLHGHIPWWNPYSGVGLPLAAEFQPAAFFPPTLLLLLPRGMVLERLLMQVLAGWGTYALLRQLNIGRLGATTCGLLYAFNGTLALMGGGPAFVSPFLPWMLFGIEKACQAPGSTVQGWQWFALSMAMILLSGFPETAYICGLLALAWFVLRIFAAEREARGTYIARVVIGGTVGISLAAPQIMPFLQYLPESWVGRHGAEFAKAALEPAALIPSLIAPWSFGPTYAYVKDWPLLGTVGAELGGFITITVLIVALFGFAQKRTALGWLLVTWILSVLAKSFGVEPVVTIWNLVPGISISAFAKYAQPTWELAIIILAAQGLDALRKERVFNRGALLVTGVVSGILIAAALAYELSIFPSAELTTGLGRWAIAVASWTLFSAVLCFYLISISPGRRRVIALCALLVVDTVSAFAIPALSSPRGGAIDTPAIEYLHANLGLQRIYSLAPIQPNFGAYFQIASINHNLLPVSTRWVDWVKTHLDSGADPEVFNGSYPRAPGISTQSEELRRNLTQYEWAGVKYVIAPSGMQPFGSMEAGLPDARPKQVYRDSLMTIFQLSRPAPYFEASGPACSISGETRLSANIDCAIPAQVLRRELFFPGWTATINGNEAPISEYQGLFQLINVPAGKSTVSYRYAPEHIGWAWLLFSLGIAAFALPWIFRKRAAR